MITLACLFLWLIFGSKNTANIRVQKQGPTWVSAKSFSSSGAFLESGFGVGFGAGFGAGFWSSVLGPFLASVGSSSRP